MMLFGHDFELIHEEFIQDLLSLAREGVIYTDHWIEEINDFRHVRITFTSEEINEYVRSIWAYELFLKAGAPLRAADVTGIPADIAKRADTYQSHTIDGMTQGPPYHCPAAFYGQHIENLLCFEPGPRRVIVQELGAQALLTTLKRAMDALTPAIRRFSQRERNLTSWKIGCEDDVRDLLFSMLRASIQDIKTEEPIPSRGGSYKLVLSQRSF